MTILRRMDAGSVLAVPNRLATLRGLGRSSAGVRAAAGRMPAAVGALSGLGAAGLIHLAWAAGSTWPVASSDELADLVVGVRPFPSGPLTLGVVALIGAGAGLVAVESLRLAAEGRDGVARPISRTQQFVRAGAWGVGGVLALRGLGGIVASAFELGTATELFRRWDLRLYSPLCLVLAALIVLAVRPNATVATTEPQ